VGYDNMQLPAVHLPSTLLQDTGRLAYTRERPWHGRSGGALFDVQGCYLIGVVSGYEVNGRGIYVSHRAILDFLRRCEGKPVPPNVRSKKGVGSRLVRPVEAPFPHHN